MGALFVRIVAVVGCVTCLSIACTAVPSENDPAGVYPTFVDIDATSGKITPAPMATPRLGPSSLVRSRLLSRATSF